MAMPHHVTICKDILNHPWLDSLPCIDHIKLPSTPVWPMNFHPLTPLPVVSSCEHMTFATGQSPSGSVVVKLVNHRPPISDKTSPSIFLISLETAFCNAPWFSSSGSHKWTWHTHESNPHHPTSLICLSISNRTLPKYDILSNFRRLAGERLNHGRRSSPSNQ